MTASIREQILSEIHTRASLTTGVSGRCYRSRAEAGGRPEMPYLVVMPVADGAERVRVIEQVDRSLRVEIGIVVHTVEPPDKTADPIAVDLQRRLMPAGDVNLGGLAIDIANAGDDFEFAHSDGIIKIGYLVQYRHADSDIASPG